MSMVVPNPQALTMKGVAIWPMTIPSNPAIPPMPMIVARSTSIEEYAPRDSGRRDERFAAYRALARRA